MKRKIKIFLFLFLFLFSLFFSIAFFYFSIYFPLERDSKREILFEIKRGEGGKEISKKLKSQGLIRFGIPFRVYVYFKGIARRLQAGYYSLSPSMTIPEIAEKFEKGDVAKEKIVIIEGWSKKEIGNYLMEKGILNSQNFSEKIKLENWKGKYDFLKDVEAEDLEGFLFPDTYFIKKDEEIDEIISKMLSNFEKKLNEKNPKFGKSPREAIEKGKRSIFEIIIMASLIEKEVRNFEEKRLVSGILWKRLENNIPLQVDATITFITGKKTTKISKEETEIDHPYNTYKYLGLPPGPICNPGLDSILAAIYPKESDFWYYLSIPTGQTIFSKTLEEHNLAKAKYLK